MEGRVACSATSTRATVAVEEIGALLHDAMEAAVPWVIKIQKNRTVPSNEAEYVAILRATYDVVFLRHLVLTMGAEQHHQTCIQVDIERSVGLYSCPAVERIWFVVLKYIAVPCRMVTFFLCQILAYLTSFLCVVLTFLVRTFQATGCCQYVSLLGSSRSSVFLDYIKSFFSGWCNILV